MEALNLYNKVLNLKIKISNLSLSNAIVVFTLEERERKEFGSLILSGFKTTYQLPSLSK